VPANEEDPVKSADPEGLGRRGKKWTSSQIGTVTDFVGPILE
jgi:hypothetical protein